MQPVLPGFTVNGQSRTNSKFCRRCLEWRPLEWYSLRALGKADRAAYCKPCMRLYCQEHYRKNKPLHLRRRYGRTVSERVRIRRAVDEYLSQHPCVDCGESNLIVLEFDHVRGQKSGEISTMIFKQTMARVFEEIAKCDVRCANCHRKKTYLERWQHSNIRKRAAAGTTGGSSAW